jgi:Zn-dependent protease with chaperone function
MNLSIFFLTFPGTYMVQSVFHSLIAAVVVESAIEAWAIQDPRIRQRFRFTVIFFPILSYPLYQAINPDRGTIFFRLEAFFDANRWLYLELWGGIPFYILFIFILAGTALIFLYQELIPILRHTFASGKSRQEMSRPGEHSIVHETMAKLSGEKPEVYILDDDEHLLYSTNGAKAAIYVSTGLLAALERDQIEAALAHEVAHIQRSKRPSLLLLFVLRVLMFFNPIVLIEFRRIVHGEEKICDDLAVAMTRKPLVLAETLRKLFHRTDDLKPFHIERLAKLRSAVEEYSHNIHIESRIKRLEQGETGHAGGERLKFLLALSVIVVINYFVV